MGPRKGKGSEVRKRRRAGKLHRGMRGEVVEKKMGEVTGKREGRERETGSDEKDSKQDYVKEG